MHRSVDVVHEDRPGDAELVAEPPRGVELRLEIGVRGQVLAGVRLARVEEVPAVAGVIRCELVEQRTLCGAVRSGEGAELEDDAVAAPQLRQADSFARGSPKAIRCSAGRRRLGRRRFQPVE